MIIVKLKGGLGNQLFQYAYGRQSAIKNNADLFLDTSSFKADILREFSLNQFNINTQSISNLYSSKFGDINYSFDSSFFNKRSNPFLCSNIIKEKGFNFTPIIINKIKNYYIDGYWQSEKYFSAIRSELLKEIALSPILLSQEKYILNSDIIMNSNSVSIHIRRGDYVNDPKTSSYHGVCSKDWYLKAVDYLESKHSNLQYFIFSDDMTWARENIAPNAFTKYVDPGSVGQEALDMMLMSLCKHNIIANSSFSWWGAWLNQNPEKQVVAPKKWFTHTKNDTRDLLPESWITL